MTQNEHRDLVIKKITSMLRSNPFIFEFKVKKKPKGIRIIYEVTQEEMDAITRGPQG